MKPTKVFTLLSLAFAMFLASCSKDDKDNSSEIGAGGIKTPNGECFVKSIDLEDGDVLKFEYNDKKQVVKYSEYYNNELDESTRIEYKGNQVLAIRSEDDVLDTTVLNLVNGRVASFTYKESGNDWDNEDNKLYEYHSVFNAVVQRNAEGFATKITETEVRTSAKPGSTPKTFVFNAEFKYQGGNMISQVYTDKEGDSYTRNYEYYTDKANVIPVTPEPISYLILKPSKNLLKKEIEVETDPADNYVTTYTYEFNASGLVTKEITSSGRVNTADPYIWTKTFDYNCK